MEKQFIKVNQKFVIAVVGFSILITGFLTFVLYETNVIRFSDAVTSEELHEVIEGEDDVAEYLESEKDYEAHFVTIASLIKEDQQQSLGEALLIASLPVILISALGGWWLAGRLVDPVKEAYESQERFMQDAAHELRNPLAAMSLAIENARKEGRNDELVQTFDRQTKRLVHINEDLLFLERHTAGREIEEVNLSELLEDVIEDFQPAILKKKIKIVKSIDRDVTKEMDPKDFIKLSKNLISNAIKFSKSSKTIKVALSQDKNVIFEVKDQGIGIPAEELEKVGERFFRATNASKVHGTGLGLAIVEKVVNVYGGDVAIDSIVGKGTTVKATI